MMSCGIAMISKERHDIWNQRHFDCLSSSSYRQSTKKASTCDRWFPHKVSVMVKAFPCKDVTMGWGAAAWFSGQELWCGSPISYISSDTSRYLSISTCKLSNPQVFSLEKHLDEAIIHFFAILFMLKFDPFYLTSNFSTCSSADAVTACVIFNAKIASLPEITQQP